MMLKKDTFKNDAFKNDALKMFCSGIAVLSGAALLRCCYSIRRCASQVLLFYPALCFSGIAVLSDAPLSFIFRAGKAGKKKPDALKTSGP